MTTRREFILQVGLGSAAMIAAGQSQAAALPLVVETDPQPTALGYKSVASKVDKAKFPKYADGQKCANCALYQGKPGDAEGGCPLYAGKAVLAGAWCSAYNKKAG